MGVIRRRPQFLADEEAIYAYLADRNPAAARKLLADLDKHYQTLADNPLLGVAQFARHPNARIFPHKKYVILYTVLPARKGVSLVRLYGPMADWRPRAVDDVQS